MEANLVRDKAAAKVMRWMSLRCKVFKFSVFRYKQETVGYTVDRYPIFSRIMPVLSCGVCLLYIPSFIS
jgi:hypothetical protein